jgi:hypothetical protein
MHDGGVHHSDLMPPHHSSSRHSWKEVDVPKKRTRSLGVAALKIRKLKFSHVQIAVAEFSALVYVRRCWKEQETALWSAGFIPEASEEGCGSTLNSQSTIIDRFKALHSHSFKQTYSLLSLYINPFFNTHRDTQFPISTHPSRNPNLSRSQFFPKNFPQLYTQFLCLNFTP